MKVLDRSPRLVRFDGFQLDLRAGELRPDAGKTLRLSEQPFRILAMLLERPGEVLTREEIRKELWPDNTIVEFEHSINAAMNRLRQALGDSGDDPHYIETLARRGYRWMVSVDRIEVGPTSDVTPRRSWRWAAAVVAALGLSAGILWFARPAPKTPEPQLTITPLTASPDPEGNPSFSPDGNQVAFARGKEGEEKWHIYVKLIGTGGTPLQLTTGPGSDTNPVWSPDGRYIAFLRYLSEQKTTAISEQKAAVMLIPALGGPERRIAEVFPGLVGCSDLTWAPDGNSLVISDRNSPKEPAWLSQLAIDTGEKRRLTSASLPLTWRNGDGCPSFSPDGRTLAFTRTVDIYADLYLLAFSNDLQVLGEAKRIELGHHSAYGPVWTEDGRAIVFGDYSTPNAKLLRIDVSGSRGRPTEPQPLTALGENAVDAAISRRGHRLAYTSFSSMHSSIWRIAAPGGPEAHNARSAGSVKRATTPFISSTRDDFAPEFSPDGKRIAFMSNRSGDWQIWVCDSDGLNPVQLTSFRGAFVTNPRWSPDGERIAFDADAEGEFDVWVINASGGKPKRMTTDPANDGNPSWSRDGRWIYFDSMRTGEQQVWKIPEAGGDAIQVTRDGGFAPLESPDGKSIYYTKDLFATSVWRLPVEGGPTTKVLENVADVRSLVLTDKGIYFIPLEGMASGSSIQFLDFANNHTKRIANFEKPLGLGLALSPEGRWILYSHVERPSSELRLVENFR